MKEVTIDNVRERMNEIEMWRGANNLSVSLKEEFELACLRQLLACLEVKPELWEIENPGEGTYFVYDAPHDQDWRKDLIVQRWFPEPPVPVVTKRDWVRAEHAEWSQATFGNVGPIGPLKHLSIEALEAAEAPGDLSEWADLQFLMWDAQRRAGITDEQITQAMIDKLAVNKARQWPEPKDGEPRLHVKEQPAPDKYNIGEATMLHIFTATGMTDVSDMQAVFDRVEVVLNGMEQPVLDHYSMFDVVASILDGIDRTELEDGWWETSTGAESGREALEKIRAAMLNQAQEPATDNTAQQFESLATSEQPEIIGYEHRMICGELRRVPKFAGQDIEATSAVHPRVSGWSERQQKVISYSLWRFMHTAYELASDAAQRNAKADFDRFMHEAKDAEEIRAEFTSAGSGKK